MDVQGQILKLKKILQSANGETYFFCGLPGTDKTRAALSYCSSHTESLYFSFQYLDASLAPVIFANRYPKIFGSCHEWQSFFAALKIYAEEKSPTIFFDRVGNLREQDPFYAALSKFSGADSSANVVLIGRPWDSIPLSCTSIQADEMEMPELADLYSLRDEIAAEIFSLTAGLPTLLAAYNPEKSFEENVWAMLRTDSVFYRLAADWMRECFRTPESYNTLLYGMAQGKNRISELSAFSGYPKNKCDKYIRALMEHGLVRKEIGKNGHSKYFPANSYLRLWYGTLFAAVPIADGSFGEDTFHVFMEYFNETVLRDFYKEMCLHWIQKNIHDNAYSSINFRNPDYYDVEIGGVKFDFAADRDRNKCFACFDLQFDAGLNLEAWEAIEKASTEKRLFYDNDYYLLTVNRVPNNFWKLSQKYSNVHIVQRKSLFAAFRSEYNRIFHPKFVPGFVRRRR